MSKLEMIAKDQVTAHLRSTMYYDGYFFKGVAPYTLPFFDRKRDPFNKHAPYQPMTLIELRTHAVLNAVRDKRNWAVKFKDPEIRAKWLERLAGRRGVDRRMIRYVTAELEWAAEHEPTAGGPDGVYVSDVALPNNTRLRLIQLVGKLEDVPDNIKDWHPRSDNQVLDLVHPSLFPLVYGRTHAVDRANAAESVMDSFNRIGSDKGTVVEVPSNDTQFMSTQFQWLPSDAQVDAVTKRVQLLSYINNLHPTHHSDLYRAIEEVLTAMVPLWESTLTRIYEPHGLRIVTDAGRWYASRNRTDRDDLTSDDDEYAPSAANGTSGSTPTAEYWDRYDQSSDDDYWERAPKPSKLPRKFKPCVLPTSTRIHDSARLAGKRIQVIVKLANIHLTPEKPEYKGGSWHVEGMLNESIIATGLYYYAVDNITDSKLAFRTAVKGPQYDESDFRGMKVLYGLKQESELNQSRGYITAHQGRIVAFPNLYQHQVQPFKLTDPTRPGYRKILAVFLVDPSKTVPSTAVVAPQQAEWMLEELRTQGENKLNEVLPVEIMDDIVNNLGGPIMSLAEAKKYRLELMDERTALVSHSDKTTFNAPFNLCEH